jgi:hypothetical protein
MNKKNLIIILLILIVIFLSGIVAYILIANKIKAPDNAVQEKKVCPMLAKLCSDGSSVGPSGPNCEFAACPATQTQNNSEGQLAETPPDNISATPKGAVYANFDYGFQITIPAEYTDWKPMIEKDYGGKGISYIYILFKTKDPDFAKFETENFVTHEKFKGYQSIFAFTAWTKDAYKKAVEDCKKDPSPDCPATIVGQNDKYVIDMQLGNGVPPKDLESLRTMLDKSGDKGKALEFKIIN